MRNLTQFVKKAGEYQPNESPKKPEKQPSVKELNMIYKLDLRKMKIGVE